MTSHPSSLPALVADIGGTHARFALVDADGPSPAPREQRVLAVADYAGPADAVAAYLAATGVSALHAAAFALAAPVTPPSDTRADAGGAPGKAGEDAAIRLTNGNWTFVRRELLARFGLARLVLLNDFSALALSLPALTAADLRKVSGGETAPYATKAVIGPGTGLGVAGLVHDGARWLPLAGEGGHVTLAGTDNREAAIIALARREFAHVSAERLVSGSGLPLLHRLVAEVDGLRHETLDTPAIVARAVAGGDPACAATIDTFCAFLGSTAGNLGLTLGAQGGVYLGGGIVPRLGELLDTSPFRARFEGKGRFAAYLAAIPTHVVTASAPALLGAARALATSE